MQIINNDCLEAMKQMEDNSVDSIVTDPPYGLSFMGKKWDYDVPSVEIWKEAMRVLKPGGHLLSFAGSRTYHRMAVNIEDAGFEIRDQIMWVYGSGFPKSLNISKALDKKAGKEGEIVGENRFGKTSTGQKSGWNDNKIAATGRQIVRASATEEAKQWEGWGTALKPSHEPIVVARKPLSEKTVAANVLKWGTGGINIDGCRVGTEKVVSLPSKATDKYAQDKWTKDNLIGQKKENNGRFPANFIHDGLETEWSRFFYCAKASKKDRNEGLEYFEKKENAGSYEFRTDGSLDGKPTAPKANFHPTVKPTKLMQYLVRLVTPKGGAVLDPFMGSGSTGKACAQEGFDFIGIEMDEEYCKIAEARINHGD